jgi:drug/metabolite transporter (DMT)-like permease
MKLLSLLFAGFLLGEVLGPWLVLLGVLIGMGVLFGGNGKKKTR